MLAKHKEKIYDFCLYYNKKTTKNTLNETIYKASMNSNIKTNKKTCCISCKIAQNLVATNIIKMIKMD